MDALTMLQKQTTIAEKYMLLVKDIQNTCRKYNDNAAMRELYAKTIVVNREVSEILNSGQAEDVNLPEGNRDYKVGAIYSGQNLDAENNPSLHRSY